MDEISLRILNDFKIRKSKKQKQAFYEFLSGALGPYGFGVRREEYGFIKSRNIIIGDVKTSRLIISAHYDTCAALPFPNFITPQRIWIYILYQLLLVIAMLAAAIGFAWVAYFLTENRIVSFFVYALTLLGIVFQMMTGKANINNYNDNTSGVAAVINTALNLPSELMGKVAFVLFDNEEKGLLGSMQFAKAHKNELRGKPLINLDCVSEGDTILMIPDKSFRADKALTQALKNSFVSSEDKRVLISDKKYFYPSDQMSFKKTVGVASMKYSKLFGLYMDKIHTSRDTVFDEKNIALLSSSLIKFINNI